MNIVLGETHTLKGVTLGEDPAITKQEIVDEVERVIRLINAGDYEIIDLEQEED